MAWTRAIDISHWADTQEARFTLPDLIRRLIRSTVASLNVLNFPAYEQVQRPGFDGDVETPQGNRFVPTGASGWELGVDKSPKGKAEEDCEKRTAEISPDDQRRMAFVFVTPRVWQKKDDWAEDKRTKSGWRDVVALDVNDLEHWLDIAPGVDIWFTRLTGRVPQGAQDLQSYWNSVRSIADYPLTPSVFTVSRDAEGTAVQRWLAGPPSSLFMRTHGLNDGLDFLSALSANDPNEKLHNGVIVYTHEAWRHLAASRDPLVLVADPALELTAADTAGATGAGHLIFVSGPRGVMGQVAVETLRRQDHLVICAALQECGFSENRARMFGQACCGSSSILKRLITRHPETRFPEWCRDDVRHSLAPFALIGGWLHVDPPGNTPGPTIGARPPLDVWVVTEMLGCTRGELDGLVGRWQRASEPLFLRLGHSVLVASREDAWHLLGGSLTKEQLLRFRDIALLVLDEDNPAFQLEPEQRWLANIHGKVLSLSGDLRRSVVETLALMTTYPTAEVDPGLDFNGTVRWVLERALPRNATWQRWASFGNNLMVIAEADPEFFLARVEEDLRSDNPELPKLFQDKKPSIFSGAIHSDLLWSLEALAWSPLYLSRVAVALARLARQDPGGTYINRPANSLQAIFLPWLWHTNASTEGRLQALSRVLEVEPEVGWKLLTGLLPGRMPTTCSTTHTPRWRPWPEGWSRATLQPHIPEYTRGICDLAIRAAGVAPSRWADAIEGLLPNSHETTERVFASLGAIADAPAKDDQAVFPLWDQLREIVERHERHASARWAYPKGLRERLAVIRDRLAPGDPVLFHHHLFGRYPVDLPGVDPLEDSRTYDAALREARLTALRRIVTSVGAGGVLRLLGLVEDAGAAGWAVGEERLLTLEDIDLPGLLESTESPQQAFVSSYVACRHHREGWAFVGAINMAGWSSQQVATFGRCLPFEAETWQWVRGVSPEAEREYWSRGRGYLHKPDLEQVRTACLSLIGVERPLAAVGVLGSAVHQKIPVPADFIASVLEATYTAGGSEEGDTDHIRYSLQKLVGDLQEDTSMDQMRLARIEWALLPILDRETSKVGPRTLVSLLESNPELYVSLLTTAFRSDNAPPPDVPLSEQDRIRARHSRQLLDSLVRLPGTNDQGVVDTGYFRSWVEEVRSRAANSNHQGSCDYTLGQLIAQASISPAVNWPTHAVAALMEELGTEPLFEGFEIAVVNGRGVVTRSPWEGGDLERSLADRYRELAEHARPASSKLAEVFLRLATSYDTTARHEDQDAERRKLGR